MEKVEKRMQRVIGSIMGGFGMFIIFCLKAEQYGHALIGIILVALIFAYDKYKDKKISNIIE